MYPTCCRFGISSLLIDEYSCGSVWSLVNAFSNALGKPIPYEIGPRRAGDIAECYADPSLAEKLIGFKTKKTLDDMCRDALNFQMKNPDGYTED